MNPTHILIPIEEIKSRINTLRNCYNLELKNKKEGYEKLVEGLMQTIDFYTILLKTSKQISLDENSEDIANKIYESHFNNFGEDTQAIHEFGYKQALKDLL